MQNADPIVEYDPRSILVVDDDLEYLQYMGEALKMAGYKPKMAETAHAALDIIYASRSALIITDLYMPVMTGLELLSTVRAIDPLTVGVITTAFGSVDSAVSAVRNGAYDYLFKPSSPDVIAVSARRALEHHVLQKALVKQAAQLESLKTNYSKTVGVLQDVSQKLRSPLSAVCGSTEQLAQLSQVSPLEIAHEVLQKSAADIRENAQLMRAIIDELEPPKP